MMKVKFFRSSTDIYKLEDEINKWMSEDNIGPADLYKVCQTEAEDGWTISIWYLPIKTVQS